MLVLSRKPDQTIYIGQGISVTVCSIKGNKVRLAIEAPKDVPISRDDLDPKALLDRHGITPREPS